jgi:HCNGP-like protein.
MEALTQGYASDSSSCSSDDRKQQIPSHLGLFANYDTDDNSSNSSSSSRNSDIQNTIHQTQKDDLQSTQGQGQEEEKEKERLPLHHLPPPVLSSSEPHSASLVFSKNYLMGKSQCSTINNNPILMEKLDQLYQNENAGGKSFAEHLKCQKEFGNPHLFPSIIEHFGIDEMESNIGQLDDGIGSLEESSLQENGPSRKRPRLKLNIENLNIWTDFW